MPPISEIEYRLPLVPELLKLHTSYGLVRYLIYVTYADGDASATHTYLKLNVSRTSPTRAISVT